MMGHRGVRLSVTYPEITAMQVRAIFEAASELKKAGKDPKPELMVPVTCDVSELEARKVFDQVRAEVRKQTGIEIECLYGTMIEIPRACLLADKMAAAAEFFSFGTNDLTQMTFGFSRDDIGGFLGAYLEQNLLERDPFQTIELRRRRRTDEDRGREGTEGTAGIEDRHLRRARRRSGQCQVLRRDRAELRELFALPGADRAALPPLRPPSQSKKTTTDYTDNTDKIP